MVRRIVGTDDYAKKKDGMLDHFYRPRLPHVHAMNKDDRVKKNGMLGQFELGFYRLDYFTTILYILL